MLNLVAGFIISTEPLDQDSRVETEPSLDHFDSTIELKKTREYSKIFPVFTVVFEVSFSL